MSETKHTPEMMQRALRHAFHRDHGHMEFCDACKESKELLTIAVDSFDEMLAALKVAQHSLRAWNAMGMSGDVGKQVAAAYENSPEMKVIAAAIAKAGTQ